MVELGLIRAWVCGVDEVDFAPFRRAYLNVRTL